MKAIRIQEVGGVCLRGEGKEHEVVVKERRRKEELGSCSGGWG